MANWVALQSERPCTIVPVGSLHTAFRWYTSTSTFHQPQPTCRTASSALHLHVWRSGFRSRWPNSLEQSPGFHQGPVNQHWLFQTFTEDVICLRDTSACSALEVDNFMRYINLLTYLLTLQCHLVKGKYKKEKKRKQLQKAKRSKW